MPLSLKHSSTCSFPQGSRSHHVPSLCQPLVPAFRDHDSAFWTLLRVEGLSFYISLNISKLHMEGAETPIVPVFPSDD